jgi:glutamate-1-semialdehyde 2,1-aminomutase
MKKTAVIIQARMGSKRLPGKIMKKIMGKPMIEYLIQRISESKLVDDLIIATSDQKENLQFIDFLKTKNLNFYVGDEEDVLSRYYYAAKKYNVNNIVRITADCPLIDPEVVDNTINVFLKSSADYSSNIFPRSFPKGLDTEVFSFETLEKTFNEAISKYDREHVTPYIRECGKFKISNYSFSNDYSKTRLTVDYEEDFILVEKIFNFFNPKILFGCSEILSFLDKQPQLLEINKHLN